MPICGEEGCTRPTHDHIHYGIGTRSVQELDNAVDHPSHYNQVPGIECIDVVEHFSFNRGNAIKYLWRAGEKGNLKQDLEKAIWYIRREIEGI